MEKNKTSTDSNNEAASSQDNEENSAKKEKLRKQITELKSLIWQLEWNTDISTFEDIKDNIKIEEVNGPTIGGASNVELDLQSDLYRFSGFYCKEINEEGCIFNFSSLHKYDKENTFGIQIICNQKKPTIGQWVMPMSIDMNDIISKANMSNLSDIPRFLRTCKHHVDCYTVRLQQFKELSTAVSKLKNSSVQSDLGCTRVILELAGVHNAETDKYINLVIYLIYEDDETRPQKIEIDSNTEQPLNRDTRKQLKSYLKCFKSLDLCNAFDQIFNGEKGPYIWSREDDSEDSLLEVNNLSGSDQEGYLEYCNENGRRASLFRRRRRGNPKRKLEQKNRTIEDSMNKITTREKSNSPAKKKTHLTKDKLKEIHPKQLLKTPLGKTKAKLKQTQLNFNAALNRMQQKHKNDVLPGNQNHGKNKTGRLKVKKAATLLTSTPMRRNANKSDIFNSLNNSEISDITVHGAAKD